MNLLAKIKNCGALLIGLAFFYSCEEKGSFGIATDDVAPVEFISTDVEIQSSVVLLDSIITSDLSRVLFGKLNNSPFGNPLVATGYIGLSPNISGQPDITSDAVLDSVQINFKINYLFDTTQTQRSLEIELYDIAEEFEDTTYINSNSLTSNDILLANGTFQIDLFDTTYALNITEDWGNEFFEGVRNDEDNFTNEDLFKSYFPGFTIKTSGTIDNFFSLDPGSDFELVFYYSEPNEDNTEILNKSFKMTSISMPNFYNVSADRGSTQFASVMDVSTEYENTGLIGVQAGVGLLTKLDLSALEEFSENTPEVIINLAEIEIGPIEDFNEGEVPPASLALLLTDERNTRIPDRSSFRAIQEDGANPLTSSSPVQLRYNPETKSYVGSITSFAKAYYGGTLRRNEYFIYPSELNTSLKSFTLQRENINLKIFYSELR